MMNAVCATRSKKRRSDFRFTASTFILLVFATSCASGLETKNESGSVMKFDVDVYANVVAWSPDSRYLAASDQRGHLLYVWDIAEKKLKFKVLESAGAYCGLAYTPDGKFIVSSPDSPSRLPAFMVWDAQTGNRVREVLGPTPKAGTVVANRASLLLSNAKANYVVAIPANGNIGIYETTSWSSVAFFQAGEFAVVSASLSDDGDKVAIGLSDGRVEIWQLSTQLKLKEFLAEDNPSGVRPKPTHFGPLTAAYRSGYITALTFSPGDKFLAVGSFVGAGQPREQLRLWDWQTETMIRAYDTGGERQITFSVSYRPDGERIVTASDATPVRIWDAKSSALMDQLYGQGPIAAFSPDGRHLAYGGQGTIYVMNTMSGK